ncbi:MAG: chemotaxis protein CheW [Sphingomonadaceae bacterium]|nr:chemotaxis protein CheW [Sphingomonadaceae bacterium]
MTNDLLIARVAGERIALAAIEVQSVIELGEIVPVPLAPRLVAGLATQRSRTLTVIDVALALDLAPTIGGARFAVVVEIEGVGYALAVDAVEHVIPALSPVQPAKIKLSPGWLHCAAGMVDTSVGTVLKVDLTRLVAGPEQKAA